MLFIHPSVQLALILLCTYVFFLGAQRARQRHLHQHTVFRWERHVALGRIALCLLLGGLVGGLAMVRIYWHRFLVTGLHGKIALVMLPLMLFGLFSGIYMNSRRKNRAVLPVVHGLNNALLLGLAITQIVTGIKILRTFLQAF
jgi:hypothetical protein